MILNASCSEKNTMNTEEDKLTELKTENDSLKNVLAEIKNKYVFDSVSVRNIPHYKNSNKLNSTYKGEIVFIGYNNDTQNSRVIMVDSISYNPEKLYNPDTLELQNGGYKYELELNEDEIYWRSDIKTQHKYGAKKQGVLMDKITTKSNCENNVYSL